MAAPGERYFFLDGLRGLAAACIVIHHFTTDTGHGELFASAGIAVDFFFCLSGFVIAHAYHARILGGMNIADYASKRLSRLYPMYLIGTILGLFGVILLYQAGLTSFTLDQIARAAALNIFYIPYVNEGYIQFFSVRVHDMLFPLDNPAWSLFFGIVANVLYAACLRAWRNSPLALMLVSAVGLCIATIYLGGAPGFSTRTFIGGLPRVLFSFFAGVVIFQFHHRTTRLDRVSAWVIVVAFVALTGVPHFEGGHRYYWLVAVITMVPLLVAMGSWVQVREGSAWQRLCTYSGRISYPVFCLHYPLLVLFSLLPRDDRHMELLSLTFVDFLGLSVAYFCTTLVLAHYTMIWVEEPLREWLGSVRNRLAIQRQGPS